MGNIDTAIDEFIYEEIKLNRTDISAAVSSREWFLRRLQNEINRRSNEPILYTPSPFVYFGSYFKRTKVSNVDEFDVLVVIDCNTGVFSKGGTKYGIGQGNAIPNYRYANKYRKSDNSGVSPTRILNWLQSAVATVTESFGGQAPERDGQAITAYIQKHNFKIDLVPAGIFKRNDDDSIFYIIPKGDKEGSWIITSPREDINLLDGAAKNNEGFRNLVRLCKYIKNKYRFSVSSFAIESAVVQYQQTRIWTEVFSYNVREVLIYIAMIFKKGLLPDPYDFKVNLLAGVSSLDWYAQRVENIVSILDRMEQEEDQDKVIRNIYRAFKNE
ncbi:hypothetical protein ACFOLF_06210 [Paenibacillus sepulcri]|uniref:Nucleotidyltransferase n=1 Tax=Paenibacillus sepulcri TaxID=359917 RepID=A0ABS7BXC5_9BACL|nr:hypothetical protein [Paenibacillus sepulcri]